MVVELGMPVPARRGFAAQRGLLYKPGAMVYCENCGRLLFKQEQDKPAGS